MAKTSLLQKFLKAMSLSPEAFCLSSQKAVVFDHHSLIISARFSTSGSILHDKLRAHEFLLERFNRAIITGSYTVR
jgi:hypothetical protein